MFQIVDTDNHGSDYPNEKFLLWPMSESSALDIAFILNRDAGEQSNRYYKVVELPYKLQPGFEP